MITGENGTFTAEATGDGKITYQWYKDGNKITGATSTTYKIAEAKSSDEGEYYCVITQVYRDSTITLETEKATLTVYSVPTMGIDGNNKNYVGEETTFTASTSGSFDSATYKWYYNTVDVAGDVTIENTNSSTSSGGIYNVGIMTMESGEISGTIGIYNTKTAIVNINGGSVVSTSSSGFGVYNGETTGWRYDGEGNITDGTVTLKIGDYVDYDEQTGASTTTLSVDSSYTGRSTTQVFNLSSYTYGWRVMGVDEDTGEILLLSEDYIGPDSGGS